MNITNKINKQNVDSVRSQIMAKGGSNPYFSTVSNASSITTDMDSFPYNRQFRGVYYYHNPIVFEREAGYRARQPECYKKNLNPEKPLYPNHCFQVACSTVYPCYPEFEKHYADKEEMELLNNRACVIEYR